LDTGFVDTVLPSSVAATSLIAKETYGQICLSGGKTNTATYSAKCPADVAARSKVLSIIEGGIDPTLSCQIDAVLCYDSAGSCPSSASGLPTYTVTLTDGVI
jgi:hypothetical protein